MFDTANPVFPSGRFSLIQLLKNSSLFRVWVISGLVDIKMVVPPRL